MRHVLCPGAGCQQLIPPQIVACPGHWWQVPRPLRWDVWRAWDGGRGYGSKAWHEAVAAAVKTIK